MVPSASATANEKRKERHRITAQRIREKKNASLSEAEFESFKATESTRVRATRWSGLRVPEKMHTNKIKMILEMAMAMRLLTQKVRSNRHVNMTKNSCRW